MNSSKRAKTLSAQELFDGKYVTVLLSIEKWTLVRFGEDQLHMCSV